MKTLALALITGGMLLAQTNEGGYWSVLTRTGADNNNKENAFVQPQEAPKAGNGIDQTLQFADVLTAGEGDSLLIGKLGSDVMLGGAGNDVIVGGPEHFNPAGRDHAFGGGGSDAFLWAPGDGSDFFDGGEGEDAVIFGLIGQVENDATVFKVSNDQKAGQVWINPETGLPQADVKNQPGFCNILDRSSNADAKKDLDALELTHLVQFFVRGPADAFARGDQETDNGLRVTLHLRNVEYLVCTSRTGGQIEAFDLRYSPAAPLPVSALPARILSLIK